MTLPIRLRRAAQLEFDEAVDWYETRKPGLGVRFAQAVHQRLAEISNTADRWPEVWLDVREVPVRKLPCVIYDQVAFDHVMIVAIFHSSRDPSVWQTRV